MGVCRFINLGINFRRVDRILAKFPSNSPTVKGKWGFFIDLQWKYEHFHANLTCRVDVHVNDLFLSRYEYLVRVFRGRIGRKVKFEVKLQ